MKSGFLRKLLALMFVTILVNVALTSVVFYFSSRNVFMDMKSKEMLPRANSISSVVSEYQRGVIAPSMFKQLLTMATDRYLWDSAVFIYDEGYELIAVTVLNSEEEYERQQSAIYELLPQILNGEKATIVEYLSNVGIVVGTPVYGLDATITGAVFLTKPLYELTPAINGMTMALLISILLAFIVMLVPGYISSSRFTKPLLRMTEAAKSMSRGDFLTFADEKRNDEIGVLGSSLNELSRALSQTISDLTLERNRLRGVIDGLHEGIIAIDNKSEVTHCNPAAYKLLGVEGYDFSRVFVKLNALWPGFDKIDDDELQSNIVSISNGELQLTLTQLSGAGGGRAGAVVLVQDITEQMRLEQTRRDYVANVSHELRTPIASIRSLADALNDNMVKTDDDKHRYYGYILRESIRISLLIDDLLELSRLQSGSIALEKSRFDLKELLTSLSERFFVLAGDSGLVYSFNSECEGELIANSNKDRVEQVLVSLIDNAVKYAEDEGEITLGVKRENKKYIVSVCNTGSIGDEHLPHIFERFYKTDTAHTGGGTGLGLSIVREIIGLLGEEVAVKSEGGRVCFYVTLDAVE